MGLIPKDLMERIPRLYATEHMKPEEITVPVKLFNPVGAQTWYITEISEDGDMAFGYCNLGDDQMAELGYVSIKELESINLPFGLKIERDLYWNENKTLKEVMQYQPTLWS